MMTEHQPLATEDGFTWLQNDGLVKQHLEQYDVIDLLESNGGLVRVENFLPTFVAESILVHLETLKPSSSTSGEQGKKKGKKEIQSRSVTDGTEISGWTLRKDDSSHHKDTVTHEFWVCEPREGDENDMIRLVTRLIQKLLPLKRSIL